MSDELPPQWSRERTDAYRPTPDASSRRFTTYRHESGDVALRVAPTMLDATERPGYELTATVYPDLKFSSRSVVRTVTTYERCERVAREFMHLFEGAYERPAALESAVEHAAAHIRPSSARDDVVLDATPPGAGESGRERA